MASLYLSDLSSEEDSYLDLTVSDVSLCEAIRNRWRLERIRFLVQERGLAALQETYRHADFDNYFPLHVAAQFSRDPELVKYLAEQGPAEMLTMKGLHHRHGRGTAADISSPPPGRTFLQLAAENTSFPSHVIMDLAGAYPEAIPPAWMGELAGLGFLRREVVRFVARSYPGDVQARDAEGCLAVHRAAMHGSVDEVKFLAGEWPAGLTEPDDHGRLPLHCAALCSNRWDVIAFLSQRSGRDVLSRADGNGRLPVHCVFENDKLELRLVDVKSLAPAWPGPRWARWRPPTWARRRPPPEGPGGEAAETDVLRVADGNGRLVLHHAARREGPVLVLSLMRAWRGALRMPDARGRRPLHYAMENNRLDPRTVQSLVTERPEAVLEGDNDGRLPLHIALRQIARRQRDQRDGEVARLLVRASPLSLRQRDGSGWLPLHYAARGSDRNLVRAMVDLWQDALQEKTTNEGWTPLHVALSQEECDREMAMFLLHQSPLSLQERDRAGWFPFHHAARGSDLWLVVDVMNSWRDALLEKTTTEGWTPLHVAVAQDECDSDIAMFLVNQSPSSLQEPDRAGWFPLHYAARGSDRNLVRAMADSWRDALQVRTTNEGWTPLHVAVAQDECHSDVAMFLVRQSPSSLQEPDRAGWFPLHYAARGSDRNLVRAMADSWRDALQERTTNEGWTPLHVAVAQDECHSDVAMFLVRQSPSSLQEPDRAGWFPLHYAARGSDRNLVRAMVDSWRDALQERTTNEGWTPLHVAVAQDECDSDIAMFLVRQSPLSLQERDHAGWFPLHYAARGLDLDLVRAIVETLVRESWLDVLQEEAPDDGWTPLPLHVATSQLRRREPGRDLLMNLVLVRVLAEACQAALGVSFVDGSLIIHRVLEVQDRIDGDEDSTNLVGLLPVSGNDDATGEPVPFDGGSLTLPPIIWDDDTTLRDEPWPARGEVETGDNDHADAARRDDAGSHGAEEARDDEGRVELDEVVLEVDVNELESVTDDEEEAIVDPDRGGEHPPEAMRLVEEARDAVFRLAEWSLPTLLARDAGPNLRQAVHLATTTNTPVSVLFVLLRSSPNIIPEYYLALAVPFTDPEVEGA